MISVWVDLRQYVIVGGGLQSALSLDVDFLTYQGVSGSFSGSTGCACGRVQSRRSRDRKPDRLTSVWRSAESLLALRGAGGTVGRAGLLHPPRGRSIMLKLAGHGRQDDRRRRVGLQGSCAAAGLLGDQS